MSKCRFPIGEWARKRKEKQGVLVESNRCIMALNKQCEELHEKMDNLKKKVKFQGANYQLILIFACWLLITFRSVWQDRLNLSFSLLGRKPRNFVLILCIWLKGRLRAKILSSLRTFWYCPLAGWVFILGTVCPWLVESLIFTLVTFQSWSRSVNSILI